MVCKRRGVDLLRQVKTEPQSKQDETEVCISIFISFLEQVCILDQRIAAESASQCERHNRWIGRYHIGITRLDRAGRE